MKKLLTGLFIPFLLIAEQPELWQAAKVSKHLNDTYTLSVESDFRSFNMGEQLKYYHGDIGISFPLIANVKLSINFREVFELKNETWKQEHRPHGTLSTKMKLGKLDISARTRFEYRMKQDKNPVIRNREMITVKFGKGFTPLKLVPYAADEIFYDFEESELNRNRFYVGFEIKSISFMKAIVYYLQQNDLKDDEWKPTNIVGMKFSF
ncbi:MAG: DUF2490 domain-containing protein [Candidatus Marinimicrobia bacterium]|nr:DUF2490 domain-containing protein [Candidatus Neomarinimicrobiota bacterium]MCH7763743.1 DUF2490 domain-containing protein [Candidatus Neomarinimicrobiota bacterium]